VSAAATVDRAGRGGDGCPRSSNRIVVCEHAAPSPPRTPAPRAWE